MNNIDDKLRSGRPGPRRPLSADFTSKTIARLDDGQRERPRPWWKEFIPMKFVQKPLFAGLAVAFILLAGGTTYAAVNGWNVRTLFGGEKKLANGSRVVKVDAKGCPHVDAFNVTNKNRATSDAYYYRIQPGVPLTNQQVVDYVTTTCEADAEGAANTPANQALQAVINKPENKDKVVGGYGDAVVAQVAPGSLTITFPTYGMNAKSGGTTTQQFTQIDPAVVVTNGPAMAAYSDIHVGDHVTVKYRATGAALSGSETIRPDQVDASQQVLVSVSKLSPVMQKYYGYSWLNKYARDIEQVKPCDSQPDGYCTAAQWQDQSQK